MPTSQSTSACCVVEHVVDEACVCVCVDPVAAGGVCVIVSAVLSARATLLTSSLRVSVVGMILFNEIN